MPLFRAGRPFILIFILDVSKYQGKNKTQGKGLKIDFNDGKTCQTKICEKSYTRPLKTGVSPRLAPALRLWRGIIAIMSRCTLAVGGLWPAACGLLPTLAEHARRVKLQYCRYRSSTSGRSKTGRSSQPYQSSYIAYQAAYTLQAYGAYKTYYTYKPME